MTLLYRGLPVPFGAEAKLKEGGSGIVGDDGQVYLTGVPEEGEISVAWSGAKQCTVHYHLAEQPEGASIIMQEEECH
nr:FimD/PapC C-terminal domain-containing protein [Escherichia coli]